MEVLELAKQGDPKAIANLINCALQTKGITAKAAVKNGCLQVILESAQAPDQQSSVNFVRKEVLGLRFTSVQKVRVCGRQTGLDFTVWAEEFKLHAAKSSASSTPTYRSKPLSQPKVVSFVKEKSDPLGTILMFIAEKPLVLPMVLILIFLLNGLGSSTFSDWNCDSAKNAVRNTNLKINSSYRDPISSTDINAMRWQVFYQHELYEAKSREHEACGN